MDTFCCCGPHVSKESTLLKTLQNGGKCSCIQTFLGNPRSYSINTPSSDDIVATGNYIRKAEMKLYIHSPYVINLANKDETMTTRGKESLSKILDVMKRVDPDRTGTILHIGANGTLQNVIKNLNDINISSPLFLEVAAGDGSKIGKNWNELRLLLEGVNSHNINFCIDTQHVHASGLVDMRSESKINNMFDTLETFNKRCIFHLNDSAVEYCSCKDRHASLGQGMIWDINKSESLSSLRYLREGFLDLNYDVVLETPGELDNILYPSY